MRAFPRMSAALRHLIWASALGGLRSDAVPRARRAGPAIALRADDSGRDVDSDPRARAASSTIPTDAQTTAAERTRTSDRRLTQRRRSCRSPDAESIDRPRALVSPRMGDCRDGVARCASHSVGFVSPLLARRASIVDDGDWLLLAQRLAHRLDISRPVTLLRSDRSCVPMTWGLVYPTVLLPTDADDWTDRAANDRAAARACAREPSRRVHAVRRADRDRASSGSIHSCGWRRARCASSASWRATTACWPAARVRPTTRKTCCRSRGRSRRASDLGRRGARDGAARRARGSSAGDSRSRDRSQRGVAHALARRDARNPRACRCRWPRSLRLRFKRRSARCTWHQWQLATRLEPVANTEVAAPAERQPITAGAECRRRTSCRLCRRRSAAAPPSNRRRRPSASMRVFAKAVQSCPAGGAGPRRAPATPDRETLISVAQAAVKLTSAYDKAELLVPIAKYYLADDGLATAYLDAAASIDGGLRSCSRASARCSPETRR